MHDWVLKEIAADWSSGHAVLRVVNAASEVVEIRAEGVKEFHMQRWEPWGASVSINRIDGPAQGASGASTLEIEMQSGDVIRVTAQTILLPPLPQT